MDDADAMDSDSVTLPSGSFKGYERNGLAALPPDDELTRVGPQTPCGEYLRRFWMPIALTSMVGDLPLRLRRMGEDLVLFRDRGGKYGLLHLLCCHRNASLEFGIVEDHGIRCCYHGWLFDVDGTILDTPGEPQTSRIRHNLAQGAYPVVEHQGMVFAYFGPIAEMPPFPLMDMMDQPDNRMVPFLIPSPCNWLQVFENSTDPYHVTFLHTRVSGVQFQENLANLPVVDYHERAGGNGVFFTSTRRVGDLVWFRVHDHMLPNFSQNGGMHVEGSAPTYFVRTGLTRWVVPIDDTNTITIAWRHFNRETDPHGKGRPELCGYNSVDFYGQTDQRSYEERQRNPGDYEVWCSQGSITVHAREHLAFTDAGVAAYRRRLRRAIRRHRDGERPIQPTDGVAAPVPTYGGDTVLHAPLHSNDDRGWMSDLSKRVAEVYRSGDDAVGEARRSKIREGLVRLEATLA
jgi:phenylpropionate dioxygenase-like ring-hydroxylating dioxygenase large terminal subunit